MSVNPPVSAPRSVSPSDLAPQPGTPLAAVPDPATPPSGLLLAAHAVGELAARHAQDADTSRRLEPEVVDALVAAGFAGWLVPRRWGGAAGSFSELTEAVAKVGEGCASAAWIGSLLAYTARFAAFLPLEGQAEVWEKGAGARVVSSLVSSTATAVVAPGGWRLSGTWTYTSGVDFSDWALVMAPAPVDGAEQDRFFAVPREAYTIEETWFTVGMRATGSHSLVLADVFVPEHRTFPLADVFAGRNAVSVEPCHALPLYAVNGLTFGAPVLGAARGALLRGGEHLAMTKGRRSAPGESHQIAYARSAGEIDAAGLLLERIAAALDRPPLAPGQVARGTRDAALAADLLVGAVDRLYRGSGTRGQAEADPMPRVWRDVHAASSHFVLQFEPAALAWTRGTLALA
jgi:two-component flavin-dependent monooxygenase/oxygenase LndZ5